MDTEYKKKIETGVREAFGYFPDVTLRKDHVTVTCETYGRGITYKQIMALRDLFEAEFDIDTEYTDGIMTDSGTWFPGEKRMIFTYTRNTT